MTGGECVSIGEVLFLRCKHCNPPKDKYFVVMHVRPLRMFLINSEITPFVQNKPKRVALMVPLSQQDHDSFLKHDSYLACDHVSHEYSYERIERILELEPRRRSGMIHQNARGAIEQALRANALVPGKYLRELRAAWGLA